MARKIRAGEAAGMAKIGVVSPARGNIAATAKPLELPVEVIGPAPNDQQRFAPDLYSEKAACFQRRIFGSPRSKCCDLPAI
jgi:hypothetical protein